MLSQSLLSCDQLSVLSSSYNNYVIVVDGVDSLSSEMNNGDPEEGKPSTRGTTTSSPPAVLEEGDFGSTIKNVLFSSFSASCVLGLAADVVDTRASSSSSLVDELLFFVIVSLCLRALSLLVVFVDVDNLSLVPLPRVVSLARPPPFFQPLASQTSTSAFIS